MKTPSLSVCSRLLLTAVVWVGLVMGSTPSLHAAFCPCDRNAPPYPGTPKDKGAPQPDGNGGQFKLKCTNKSRSGDFVWTYCSPPGAGVDPKVIGQCVFTNGCNSTSTIENDDGTIAYYIHICVDEGTDDGAPWDAVVNIFCVAECIKIRLCMNYIDGEWVEDVAQRQYLSAADFAGMSPADTDKDKIPDEGFNKLTEGLYPSPVPSFPSLFESAVRLTSHLDGLAHRVIWDVGELRPVLGPDDFILFRGLTAAHAIQVDPRFNAMTTALGLRLSPVGNVPLVSGETLVLLRNLAGPVEYAVVDRGAVPFYHALVSAHPNVAIQDVNWSFDPRFRDMPGYAGGAGVIGPSAGSVSLVATGALWKYVDDGTDQGTVWATGAFDASSWSNGVAELGFGDGDEATVIQGGPGTNRFVTAYFRHLFTVEDAAVYSNLLVRLKRDDGGIVYLNDVEVFRSNMPTGAVDYLTLATVAAPDDGTNFQPRLLPTAGLLQNGLNIVAVEIHQNSLTSSDTSFDLELLANVNPVPPTVTLTSPTNGSAFQTPVNVPLAATAGDTDGSVVLVEFFADGIKVGEDGTAPFAATWSNAPPGLHVLTARATDDTGFTADSTPVNIVVIFGGEILVARGATWKFLDDGSDQTAMPWTQLSFPDTGWSEGPAELGYGETDEATVINGGPATNHFITTYFRHVFNVSDPSAYSNLVVRLLRDDGAIVHLNGVEVFRSNMPTGAVDYLTLAATTVGGADETTFFQQGVNPALLVPGPNVLAVEVHQSAIDSSDVSFDLTLMANVPGGPPTVTITSPPNGAVLPQGNITITATAADSDGHVTQVEFFAGVTSLGVDLAAPYTVVWPAVPPGTHVLTAKATDNSGTMTVSAPVNIVVIPGTTLAFRQGLDAYAGTEDTDVRAGAPDNAFGANTTVSVDGDVDTAGSPVNPDPAHALLRFDGIVGAASNQIPPNAAVALATLSFRTANGSVNRVNMHRMLAEWTEASTWNSLVNGVSADDVEAGLLPEATFTNNTVGTVLSFNVTPAVQAWVNGAANHGWTFLPTGNDGYQFNSSEAGTATQRPTLTVTYAGGAGPRLAIQLLTAEPPTIELSWMPPAGFVLEEAPEVIGPWNVSAVQANPQLRTPADNARFFRLRSQ